MARSDRKAALAMRYSFASLRIQRHQMQERDITYISTHHCGNAHRHSTVVSSVTTLSPLDHEHRYSTYRFEVWAK